MCTRARTCADSKLSISSMVDFNWFYICIAQNVELKTWTKHLTARFGEPLSIIRRESRNWEDEIEVRAEEFGEKAEQFGKRMSNRNWDMEDNCFGPRNRSTGPLIFGVIIILVGLSTLLEKTYSWARFDNLWPVIIIGIGLMVVYNAVQRRK